MPTPEDISAFVQSDHGITKGIQLYEEVSPGQLEQDAVGRPLMHQSAAKHATGEAVYCDDVPPYESM